MNRENPKMSFWLLLVSSILKHTIKQDKIEWKCFRLGSSADPDEALRPLQTHSRGCSWHLSRCRKVGTLPCWHGPGEGCFVNWACVLTAGIKMAMTTSESTEMMNENWLPEAP